jgi:protein-tyrosine-phosphatase
VTTPTSPGPALTGGVEAGRTLGAIDILMVCSGNTCRSPMAMALLDHHLRQRGVVATVHSAGTLGWGGPATANSITVLAERGISLDHHQSRRIDPGMVVGADLVLGMTRDHVGGSLARDPTAVDRTFIIGELVRLAERVGPPEPGAPLRLWTGALAALREPNRPPGRLADEIADPVGEPLDVYRRTADRLDVLTDAIAELLAPVRRNEPVH